LWAAVLTAQRAIEPVVKDSYNRHHGFAYASAEEMMVEARRVLLGAGLVLYRSRWWLDGDLAGPEKSTALVWFEAVLRHPASGGVEIASVPWPAVLEKGRPWDKAVAIALTTGWAYYVRDLLQIPRCDAGTQDGRPPQVEERDDRGFEPERGKRGERERSLTASDDGPAIGEVPKAYWDARRAKDVEAMNRLLPHPLARTRKDDVGEWVFYLPADAIAAGAKVATPVPAAADPTKASRGDGPKDADDAMFRPKAAAETGRKHTGGPAIPEMDEPDGLGPDRWAWIVGRAAAHLRCAMGEAEPVALAWMRERGYDRANLNRGSHGKAIMAQAKAADWARVSQTIDPVGTGYG